ncbi:MAG: MBL fold metallo-hydrolase [Candidatus Hodarchaeota archaeon]
MSKDGYKQGVCPIFREIASLLIFSTILTACGPITRPDQTVIPPSPSPQADSPAESAEDRSDPDIHIWSLGGNGWALVLGNRLLIFDYVESTDPNPPAADEARNLQRGYINTEEIKDYEVYVFVTHSHQDHYDPVIFEWQEDVDTIRYIFGWQAGHNPDHHYLIGPRAHGEIGSLKVYTINSHHAGVPEVAYLVQINGTAIYHNGDYMSSYVEDFEYLKSISDHIVIAFVIGWPYIDHQQFQQALLLSDLFSPDHLFAICREGDEEKCRQFKDLLIQYGIDANIEYPDRRGDEFIISDY